MSKDTTPVQSVSVLNVHDDNIETRQVILQGIGVPGVLAFDALTDDGWRRGMALEFDEEYRDGLIRAVKEAKSRAMHVWRDTRFVNVIRVEFRTRVDRARPSVPLVSHLHPQLIEDRRNDWVQSPQMILDRLESDVTTPDDRITAVLFAETMIFDGEQKPRLLRCLFKFANDNRFSQDDEVKTAVGSAIRKFAMNMPESSFEDYSTLLVPTGTDTLSCEIELELAKAIGWRLIRAERTKAGVYPHLEARLSGLASDYLATRLILQKNYASIVIHAVIAVALLNGSRKTELINRIAALRIDWFSDLFSRRLAEVIHKRQAMGAGYASNLKLLHKRLHAAGR